MILSNIAIHKAMDEGRILIKPEPTPRFKTEGKDDCPYQTTAVDLRLASELSRIKEGKGMVISLTRGGIAELTAGENSDRIHITDEQPFILAPGKFILGQTLERVALPLPKNAGDPCYSARIEGRSSYSRAGLLVHFTAPTIHAGFGLTDRGTTITLELCNFGLYPIELRPEARICQLIFEEVSGIPFKNESQFQTQVTPDGQSTSSITN